MQKHIKLSKERYDRFQVNLPKLTAGKWVNYEFIQAQLYQRQGPLDARGDRTFCEVESDHVSGSITLRCLLENKLLETRSVRNEDLSSTLQEYCELKGLFSIKQRMQIQYGEITFELYRNIKHIGGSSRYYRLIVWFPDGEWEKVQKMIEPVLINLAT